ncbi:MAG: putative DNA-binding domain-containing protein [Rhizobacter sp.]|nr:putative DNA-binding domain-containing protein [Rhizobacter sp.]
MSSSLAHLQRRMREAIAGEGDASGLLRTHPGREPLLRLYRHAYRARLVAALRDNFGVLPRAMGDEAFEALALAYLQARPSQAPSIRWFGDRLVDFMAAHDALVPHPAFVDLARMEWALRAAFDAADAPRLVADTLAQRPAAEWPSLVLRLHPSVHCLELAWAVEPAWRALQGDDEPELPEPQPLAHTLVVWRPALDTRWRSAFDELESVLLAAVARGEPFAALCEHAAGRVGEAQAAARVVAALQQWVAEGLLAG